MLYKKLFFALVITSCVSLYAMQDVNKKNKPAQNTTDLQQQILLLRHRILNLEVGQKNLPPPPPYEDPTMQQAQVAPARHRKIDNRESCYACCTSCKVKLVI